MTLSYTFIYVFAKSQFHGCVPHYTSLYRPAYCQWSPWKSSSISKYRFHSYFQSLHVWMCSLLFWFWLLFFLCYSGLNRWSISDICNNDLNTRILFLDFFLSMIILAFLLFYRSFDLLTYAHFFWIHLSFC